MTGPRLFRSLLLSLFLLSTASCATGPITEQYRKEALSEGLTFPMVLADPDHYIGDMVLWGGSIVETINLAEETEIIVLETPLGTNERPGEAINSRGRFIALSSKFLDPAVYREGRKITLAGRVAGKRALSLGQTTYTYPVVMVKQFYLWPRNPPYYRGWVPWWDVWIGF